MIGEDSGGCSIPDKLPCGLQFAANSVRHQETVIRKPLLPKDVFREDAVPRADAAIVLGAADPDHLQQRISTGTALYMSGKTRTLILCGDGRSKHPSQQSEAIRMRDFASAAGVPPESTILDDRSGDPVSSAKECSRLLKSDERLKDVRSVFLVSSAWHMLRLFLIFRHHLPHRIAVFCHPATTGYVATSWQATPQGRAVVDNELRLIEKLLKTGYSLP